MNEEQMIEWIDTASTEELLRKWRFGNSSNLFFQGVVGDHYGKVIAQRRDEDPAAWTLASKQIGWDR